MKIVKRNKAIEINKRVYILVKNVDELIEVLNWHKKLDHFWNSGSDPFDENMINKLNEMLKTYSVSILSHHNFKYSTYSNENNTISFNDFKNIAYENS